MHPKYREVIKLRKRGKSYREIAKAVGVSKNSVSRWCKNLKLSLFAQKILAKKSNYPKELFAKYNQLKAKKVRIENRKIEKEAIKEIRTLPKYGLKLIGAALYWGEGYKNKNEPPSHKHIQFANSDPEMVALFLRFLREILKTPEEKFNVSIRIHPNIDAKLATKFWAKITKIPENRFHITTQISKASGRKRPQNSLPYGTLSLEVHSRQKFSQIKGWINGLIRQI